MENKIQKNALIATGVFSFLGLSISLPWLASQKALLTEQKNKKEYISLLKVNIKDKNETFIVNPSTKNIHKVYLHQSEQLLLISEINLSPQD